jgi:hypothetical protein
LSAGFFGALPEKNLQKWETYRIFLIADVIGVSSAAVRIITDCLRIIAAKGTRQTDFDLLL